MNTISTRNAATLTGMWFFLAADAMFFGALLSSLVFLRVAAGSAWPAAHRDLPAATSSLTLVILLGMACAIAEAWRNSKCGADATAWLRTTGALGVGGALSAMFPITVLYASGRAPAAHNLYGLFALVAGLIGLHALCAGVAALVLSRPRNAAESSVEALGLFVHFMAVIALISLGAFFVL